MVIREIQRPVTTRSALEGSNLTGDGVTHAQHGSSVQRAARNIKPDPTSADKLSGATEGHSPPHRCARLCGGHRSPARVRVRRRHGVHDRPRRGQHAGRHRRRPGRRPLVHRARPAARDRPHHDQRRHHAVPGQPAPGAGRDHGRPRRRAVVHRARPDRADRPPRPRGRRHHVHVARPRHDPDRDHRRQGRRALLRHEGHGQDRPHHDRGRGHRVRRPALRRRHAQRRRRRPGRRHLVHRRARAAHRRRPHLGRREDRPPLPRRRQRPALRRRPHQHAAEPDHAASDGKLYFTESDDPAGIGRIKTDGSIKEYRTGSDRRLGAVRHRRGRRRRALVHRRRLPGRSAACGRRPAISELTAARARPRPARPNGITRGPDGNIWYTGSASPAASAASPSRRAPSSSSSRRASPRHDLDDGELEATVAPNSQPTTFHVEYGPEKDEYDQQSAPLDAGDGADEVEQIVELDLEPSSHYHARLVATNGSGEARSDDVELWTDAAGRLSDFDPTVPSVPTVDDVPKPDTGKPADTPGGGPVVTPPPAADGPVAPPVLGEAVVVRPLSGAVRVKTPGAASYAPLAAGANLPVGTLVDTRAGRIRLQSARNTRGRTQSGTFWGGVFQIRQSRRSRGMTALHLRGGSFRRCGARAGVSVLARESGGRRRVVRRLWGKDKHSRFRTHGRDSVATVRGTRWSTDRPLRRHGDPGDRGQGAGPRPARQAQGPAVRGQRLPGTPPAVTTPWSGAGTPWRSWSRHSPRSRWRSWPRTRPCSTASRTRPSRCASRRAATTCPRTSRSSPSTTSRSPTSSSSGRSRARCTRARSTRCARPARAGSSTTSSSPSRPPSART